MADARQYSWKTIIEAPNDLGLEEIIKLLAEKHKVQLELLCEKKGWMNSTIEFKAVADMEELLFFKLDLVTTLRRSGLEVEIES